MTTLYILCGLPFSGKTTLAKELVKRFGFISINIDDIKVEYGIGDVDDDEVSDKMWTKILGDIDKRVKKNLQDNKSVIVESYTIIRSGRDKLREIATGLGIPTKIIYLNISEFLARQRWLKNEKSQVRFRITKKIFNEAVRDLEPPTKTEHVLEFNQNIPIADWITKNISFFISDQNYL